MNQTLWVSCYLVLLVFTGAILHLAVVFLKTARRKRIDPTMPRQTRILRSILGLLATCVCFAFFYDSMFVRFSCVEVGPGQITLRYFWPKPSRVIALNELSQVGIERDRKQRAELVVLSKRGEHRSVVCTTDVNLERARNAIQGLLSGGAAEK